MKRAVVIGGGTGTFTVLSGLKEYDLDLTAIVTVADSGGSTGRLRDEFGLLPVGDFRMALTALADSDSGRNNLLRKLFLYRFSKGEEGLLGHNFGNLFLVAMRDILGSDEKAVEFASSVLRTKGKVLPVTSSNVDLVAEYEGGGALHGESKIDEPPKRHDGTRRIINLSLKPKAHIFPKAKKAIENASLIVLGPGDLYTSLLANVVVEGIPQAIRNSKGKFVYIVNLMTKYGQTYGFTASDHVEEIRRYIGKYPDYVLVNSISLPGKILRKYKRASEFPVADNLIKNSHFKIIRRDFLAEGEIKKSKEDSLKRSLIRHDPHKLAKVLVKLIK